MSYSLQPYGLYSPPGSPVHGILQARILQWGYHFLLQGIFQPQGSNPHLFCLLHWQADSLPSEPLYSIPTSNHGWFEGRKNATRNCGARRDVKAKVKVLVTQSCQTLCNSSAPLSIQFSRQEYWSGLPFSSPGDLPNLGFQQGSLALQKDSLSSESPGKP